MEGLFTIDSLFTLVMLVLLQVVLGFDNLLYISLESKKAPADKQSYVRKLGVGMAIVLRIVTDPIFPRSICQSSWQWRTRILIQYP